MITVETINKLSNAKRVTNALHEKVKALVLDIEKTMDDLAINSLMRGKYVLSCIPSDTHGTQRDLQLNALDEYCNLSVNLCASPCTTRSNYYRYGDFNLSYNRPNRCDLMTFLHDLDAIISELASYCDEVKSA